MKRLLLPILLIFALLLIPVSAQSSYLVDDADLLTRQEERSLEEKLSSVSREQEIDVFVITTPSQYDYDQHYFDNYSDDYIVLLICMDVRTWEVLCGGEGEKAITDDRLDDMAEKFTPPMSEGDFYEGFTRFVEGCDDAITEYKEGEEFPWLWIAIGSLILGLIVALIATGSMRKKLKSVKPQRAAANYIRPGSMELSRVQDIFLFAHVSRIRKPDPPKTGGGSFSSGSFHGGRGGKF